MEQQKPDPRRGDDLQPRILVANGVNLDLLGRREPKLYGHSSLATLEQLLQTALPSLVALTGFASCQLDCFQTNDEAQYLEKVSQGWDGAILNPGAWTHTSLALADRLAALELVFIEVHISQLSQREAIRRKSYTARHARGVIYGLGLDGYLAALYALLRILKKPKDLKISAVQAALTKPQAGEDFF